MREGGLVMPTKMNREAWYAFLRRDMEWLLRMPRSLERDHIYSCMLWLLNNKPPFVFDRDSRCAIENPSKEQQKCAHVWEERNRPWNLVCKKCGVNSKHVAAWEWAKKHAGPEEDWID
jgi:hypothetical protein